MMIAAMKKQLDFERDGMEVCKKVWLCEGRKEEVEGAGGNGGAGCVGIMDIVNVPPNRGMRDAALLRDMFAGGGLRLS